MTQTHSLLLGIGLDAAAHAGAGQGDWRDFWSALVGQLDGAADFLTLEDRFASFVGDGLDAVLLANWLAPRSRQIGIIAGAPVNAVEPFHVSTAIATLDYVGEGRAGLLAEQFESVRASEASAAIGSLRGFPVGDRQALIGDAAESIEVIRRLWDSWEDDAIIRDTESQRFVDCQKLHYVDFQGSSFRVLGPSITPRPPQGQPVIAVAWSQGAGVALARAADVVFLRDTKGDVAAEIGEIRGEHSASRPVLIADFDIGSDGVSSATLVARAAQAASDGAGGLRLVLSNPEAQIGTVLNDVLPALRAAGVIGQPGAGSLRSRFGLPIALNRYAVAA